MQGANISQLCNVDMPKNCPKAVFKKHVAFEHAQC